MFSGVFLLLAGVASIRVVKHFKNERKKSLLLLACKTDLSMQAKDIQILRQKKEISITALIFLVMAKNVKCRVSVCNTIKSNKKGAVAD
jgi:hypothetical protein